MASAVARARAYNGGLGAEPPAGSRGQSPRWGVRGRSPLKLTRFLCLKHKFFNASATILLEMTYFLIVSDVLTFTNS